MNPYQPPAYIAPNDSEGAPPSLIFHATGFFVSLVGALAVAIRLCFEVASPSGLTELRLHGGVNSLVAIFALGLAAWMSLAILACVRRFISTERIPLACGLILVATTAILVRGISEPATCWTPLWPTYVVTFAGAAALGLLLRQLGISRDE